MGLISYNLNSELAPKYIRKVKNKYVLWFENSNKYILLDKNSMRIMNFFFHSSSLKEFNKSLDNSAIQNKKLSTNIYNELNQLLVDCNLLINNKSLGTEVYNSFQYSETITYKINEKLIAISYSNNLVKLLVHPQFSHLQVGQSKIRDFEFHISSTDNLLYLFTNKTYSGSFPKSEYHLLQGKFAMELLCLITNTSEDNWMGTFHASTISNNDEAIMLVGESGKGKSTLSALLMSNGFNLIADDFTPILAKSQLVYNYPSAISIKEGAFDILKPYLKKLPYNETILNNSTKGKIKFLAPSNKEPLKPISCNKIVLVNYIKNATTVLEESTIETVLNTLIPDSWLSPKSENAEHFLNWLERLNFYKLTYSNNTEAIDVFKKLFN